MIHKVHVYFCVNVQPQTLMSFDFILFYYHFIFFLICFTKASCLLSSICLDLFFNLIVLVLKYFTLSVSMCRAHWKLNLRHTLAYFSLFSFILFYFTFWYLLFASAVTCWPTHLIWRRTSSDITVTKRSLVTRMYQELACVINYGTLFWSILWSESYNKNIQNAKTITETKIYKNSIIA